MTSESIEQQTESKEQPPSWWSKSFLPVRKAIIRGLAIVMPLVLTLALFLWAWTLIDKYVLGPVEATIRHAIVWSIADIRDDDEIQMEKKMVAAKSDRDSRESTNPDGWISDDSKRLVRIGQKWIPRHVYDTVQANPGETPHQTANAYYHRYVKLEHLPRHLVIPMFLIVFILVLYLLGRVFAVGVGRLIIGYFESVIVRLPIISKVYSSVKQVTDFAFSDSEIEFTRVVAVEYPRRGVWSMGFVTGESMLDIRTAANEPIISVLMPTSPMPATGFVISVPRSHTVDLNITIDQAIQFCVSCGVVVPRHQQFNTIAAESAALSSVPPPPTDLSDSDSSQTPKAVPPHDDKIDNQPLDPDEHDPQ